MSGVQDSQDGSVLLLASSDEGRNLLSVRFTQNVWEWVLSLYHVVFRDGAQVVRLDVKHLYWLSHLIGPPFITFITV